MSYPSNKFPRSLLYIALILSVLTACVLFLDLVMVIFLMGVGVL
jgi:hypothetical protein